MIRQYEYRNREEGRTVFNLVARVALLLLLYKLSIHS